MKRKSYLILHYKTLIENDRRILSRLAITRSGCHSPTSHHQRPMGLAPTQSMRRNLISLSSLEGERMIRDGRKRRSKEVEE